MRGARLLFVADDLSAWLIGVLADAGRRRLARLALGTDSERALRQAATEAALGAAAELCPADPGRTRELAAALSQAFGKPTPGDLIKAGGTMLESLHEGISGRLAVLDEAGLELAPGTLAPALARHLIRAIVVHGAGGGPLSPLAAQLNHDATHLQGQRIENMIGQVLGDARQVVSGVGYPLPRDPRAFTGREDELGRIVDAVPAVSGAGGSVSICAIGGMPGVGKTALAVRAAWLLCCQFPGRQFFLSLHGYTPGQEPLPPMAALAALLTASGVDPRYLPADLDGRAALWRDRTAGQRTLIVLDNAADSAQVTPLLPGGDGLVLVTSRRHLGDLPGPVRFVLLDVLPPEKAAHMFARLAPRAVGERPGEVAGLVELAGHLPLAVSLLARVYQRHPSWTIADLAGETRAGMLTLAAERDSVAAAFGVSYGYLDPVRQRFFRRIGLHLGMTIDRHAAAALAGTGPGDAAAHLDALHGEGLLTEVGHRRYSMHDLIRRYARDLAATDPAPASVAAVDRLLSYYEHAAARSERLLARNAAAALPVPATPEPAALPGFDDQASALAWARAERASLLGCLGHAVRTGDHARVVALAAGTAALLRQDGPWADAISNHQTAVEAARRLPGLRPQARALADLGDMLLLTGDYPGAAVAAAEALAIHRGASDLAGQASALNTLGTARRMTGDHAGAVESLLEALTICQRTGDLSGQVSALNALGAARRISGDDCGATDALQEALDIARQVGDRRGQAYALTYLGGIRRSASDYPAAAAALDEALVISREIGDRGGEVEVLNEIGALRRACEDLSSAHACHRHALSLAREIASPWDEAHALAGIARCVLVRPDRDGTSDAVALLSRARAVFERIGAAEAASVAAELDRLIRLSLPRRTRRQGAAHIQGR